ncbi:MAG: DUF1161 domain-containing protein [Rubrivivax sp.]|nr:DUF1161 domain-containing protein [Rubrivivax sp.]MBK7260670.1 DUF1161 domain-containing protein [Rubrivivax sp.]MBK8526343.1 DUF1161 domain-containing protein [Rubrivivax sp.]
MRPALVLSSSLLLMLSSAVGAASAADNCEAISAQIAARIQLPPGMSFTLNTVDVAASAPGRVVGSCARGSRKIVYLQSAAAPAGKPASAAPDNILTECKDGTVQRGGSCKKR